MSTFTTEDRIAAQQKNQQSGFMALRKKNIKKYLKKDLFGVKGMRLQDAPI